MTIVTAKIQVRRDTAANWEVANPLLAEGESGFTTDTQIEKIGDGVRLWNDLPSRPSLEQLTAAQDAALASANAAGQSKIDASDSADLSQKWAEGPEPGGAGTKSAKEYADLAEEILGQTMDVFDHFDDRYLGQYADDPETDNDGNALIAGTLYFNTVIPGMKVYTGSETKWVAAYIPGNSLGTAAIRDAQTGPTDATLLRLLQVGAFGLGLTDAPAITDLTAAIPNGFFSFSEATVTGYPTAEAYNQMGFAVSSSNGTMVLTMRQSNNAAYAQPMLGVRLAVGAFVWMKLQTDAQVSSDANMANELGKLPTRGAVAGAIAASAPTPFETAEYAITSGFGVTVAHGLGAKPTYCALFLKCQTATGGYAVGDEVEIPKIITDNQGASIVPTATGLKIRIGSSSFPLAFVSQTTGATSGIGSGDEKWKFFVRAWL